MRFILEVDNEALRQHNAELSGDIEMPSPYECALNLRALISQEFSTSDFSLGNDMEDN